MYWIQQEAENAVIFHGSMNGTWILMLRATGLRQPTSIAINSLNFDVYWVDLARQRIEYTTVEDRGPGFMVPSSSKDFAPQRIFIHEKMLYWLGLASNDSEAIFSMNFRPERLAANLESRLVWRVTHARTTSQITGLSVQHHPNEVKEYNRPDRCENGHPCAGICLLSGWESFHCVCPVGFQPDGPTGFSCKG